MTRGLPTELNAAVDSDGFRWCMLLTLDFDSGTVFLWSGVDDIDLGGNTYKGVGAIGAEISGSVETVQNADSRIRVSLSGIDIASVPSFIDEMTDNDPTGRAAGLLIAAMTPDGEIDGAAQLMFSGFMDNPSADDGAVNKISLDLVSEAARLNKVLAWHFTAEHQQQIFSGDKGFDFVADLDDEVRWGASESTDISGPSGPSGPGMNERLLN